MGRFHFHDSAQKIGCRLSGLTCPDKHFSGHLCPDKLRTFGFGVVRENLRENVRENVRENLRENVRENLRGPHANFGWFSGGTDRGFSTIFKDSYIFQRFCTRFWSLEGSELLPKTFIFVDFVMDPSNFRMKIHKISALGAKCYRNVARSAPDMKITFFYKVSPWRAQNTIFRRIL